MNQVFDFKRFSLLVGKHWSENRKKYSLGLVAMAGLLFFWFGFTIVLEWGNRLHEELQALTYFFGLAITGCFFGSILFSELSSGPKAMNYLIFPASHLEKLLCGLLYGVVFFFIAYTLVFYIVDAPMVMIANSIARSQSNGPEIFKPNSVVNVFFKTYGGDMNTGVNPFVMFILVYMGVQSAYILGSVYFAKFSFIKTTISLLMIALVVSLFVGKVLTAMLPPGGYYRGLTSYQVWEGGSFELSKIIMLPDWADSLLGFLVKYAFAPIFWVVTYFRFKEKQV